MRRNALEAGVLLLMPIAVVAGFEAAFYTPGARPVHRRIRPLRVPRDRAARRARGRPRCTRSGAGGALIAGVALLVAMIALSYAAQLLTLTGFYT